MSKRFGRFLRRNTIALLALFVALSGTTYAAANVVLPKNSVGAKQLKKNAVTNTKIAKNAVTGSKIKLTTVGKVPSAANADHATVADTVGGQAVAKVQWKAPPGTGQQNILTFNGLTITGACDASSNISLDAVGSTANNAELRIQGNVSGTAFFKNLHAFSNLSGAVSLVNTDAAHHEGSGQLVQATVDGHVVTFSYGFDWGSAGSPTYGDKFVGCTLYGELVYS
jgi:hypothetical protein